MFSCDSSPLSSLSLFSFCSMSGKTSPLRALYEIRKCNFYVFWRFLATRHHSLRSSSLFSFCSMSDKTSPELEPMAATDVTAIAAGRHSMTEIKVQHYKHALAQNPRMSDNYKNQSDYKFLD